MRSLLFAALPLVLVSSLSGCKKHVTDCGDVADNMIVVTRDVVAKSGNPPPKKEALVAECKQRNLTHKEKVCMVQAKDVEGLAKCVGKRAQEPRDKSGMEPAPQMDLDKLPPGHPQVARPMDRPPEGGAGSSGSAASGSAAPASGSAAPPAGSGSAK